jgi:hypothetical protein
MASVLGARPLLLAEFLGVDEWWVKVKKIQIGKNG